MGAVATPLRWNVPGNRMRTLSVILNFRGGDAGNKRVSGVNRGYHCVTYQWGLSTVVS